jgi:hypothetical protein
VGVGSYRCRDQPQEVTGDAPDGFKRGAGTGLCHGRRIVRDAAVKQLPSHRYPDRPPDRIEHGTINSRKLSRLEFLRSTGPFQALILMQFREALA